MQHDSSSALAMATNTLHNALWCITPDLFKHLRLRIAIVRSAWRQPNISKHTSTVSSLKQMANWTVRASLISSSVRHIDINDRTPSTTWRHSDVIWRHSHASSDVTGRRPPRTSIANYSRMSCLRPTVTRSHYTQLTLRRIEDTAIVYILE